MTKKRTAIPQGVRFNVFRRDGFTCVYCGGSSPDVILECDHKTSVADGGGDEFENLVTSCWDCNRGKGRKSIGMPSKSRPVGLVGVYGHRRDGEGAINNQFQIIGMVGDANCTIQLFSWVDGRETSVEIVPIADFSTPAYSLYTSRIEWLWQWAVESAKARGKGLERAHLTFKLSTGLDYGEPA